MIVLDTNVISEVMKPSPDPVVLEWINRQSEDALFITTITVAEISAGIQKLDAGKRRDDLDRRLQDMVQLFNGRTLTFDLGAAMLFGRIIGEARRNGLAIGFQDGLIAATAAWRKCAVASRDVSPFEAAGVEVINPWFAPAEDEADMPTTTHNEDDDS
ncbi:type II toxin-antitoxin system VapC family toxin [Sulfitobacter pontiacus]|jgi:predicted nucleic acid-binding protein|uniref:type II toxin-antitoxin system VapC family toxin n=1 Tax=Sulfitobacter pontiacus TaxID=60137 RepID=UPI0030EC5E11